MITDAAGGGRLAPDELTPCAALDVTRTPAELKPEAQAAADGEEAGMLTSAALVKQARQAKRHREHLDPLMTSDSCEWYSPRRVVDASCDALEGRIDLDPCAEFARSIPAVRHFTAAEDGLIRQWVGTVYLNPPYGRAISQ